MRYISLLRGINVSGQKKILMKDLNIDKLMEYVKEPERLVFVGKEVYLHCPNGYGTSKLNNNFIENKLGVGATTRNWKSVVKLCELSTSTS